MMEYRFATPQDMPQVIDFIDLVFSQLRVPHDFETLLPKAYGEGADISGLHAIALDGERVMGCVACYRFPLRVNGETLQVGYIGSVSAHRHARGAGVMRRLMQMQLDRARAEGVDMLVLGGQRQRYEYYGFTTTGGEYQYSLTAPNVRHALKDADTSGIAFSPMQEGEDAAYAHALYQQQPVCGARTEDNFAVTCQSFKSQGWIIRLNGEKIGYLVACDGSCDVTELVVEDFALIPAILKAWMEARGVRSFKIIASPHEVPLNRLLSRFAEGFVLCHNGMLNCLNHERVIRTYMGLKNAVSPLSDGRLTLGVGGDVLALSVQDGVVDVRPTDAPADVALSPIEAAHLLFGCNRFYAPEVDCPIPADWFPLPQYIPQADTF